MRLSRITSTINIYIKTCKTIILTALMLMIIISIITYTLKVAYILIVDVFTPPIGLSPSLLTELFADFLLVLVGFGLIDTVKAFFKDSNVHVETVFLVAMIGVARKAILLDLTTLQPVSLLGLAAIILSLSVGYFLIKRVFQTDEEQVEQKQQVDYSENFGQIIR